MSSPLCAGWGGLVISPYKGTCNVALSGAGPLTQNRLSSKAVGFVRYSRPAVKQSGNAIVTHSYHSPVSPRNIRPALLCCSPVICCECCGLWYSSLKAKVCRLDTMRATVPTKRLWSNIPPKMSNLFTYFHVFTCCSALKNSAHQSNHKF